MRHDHDESWKSNCVQSGISRADRLSTPCHLHNNAFSVWRRCAACCDLAALASLELSWGMTMSQRMCAKVFLFRIERRVFLRIKTAHVCRIVHGCICACGCSSSWCLSRASCCWARTHSTTFYCAPPCAPPWLRSGCRFSMPFIATTRRMLL